MLTNTHSGAVGASDSAGNSYSVIADQSDGAGDRTLILAAVGAKSLAAGGSVTVTFPTSSEHHAALDAFSGVSAITGHSSATAASGPFASGAASASGGGIVFAAAGIQGGENATWSAGFTALPTLLVAPADQLATAYESAGSGSAQGSGSCNHQWMAAVVTLAG
ncbi:clec-122; C-type LECtin [Catenulispora acidiphila DSM 44928]|uniref:Clec-122 C-type LECtin n=2 Tax=Catenulispora TaxID=414878 RepID=C7Q2G1_CATAD|nr:clec-122; C-type LECtin [Catenulispora acidiphila DSM 44928]